MWYLSAVSSQRTEGLLPQLGLEDSFHKMQPVRCGRGGLENLHLMKDGESEGECEGQKGCYDGHNQTGMITHIKIVVPKGDQGYKTS